MRTTKRWVVYWIACAILGGVIGFFMAGCSQAQRDWVKRADTGVANDSRNDDKLIALAEAGIKAKEADALRSTAEQINQVMEGKLKDSDTGEAIPLTPEYVNESMDILKGQLAAIQKERETIYQAKTDNDENRRQIKQALYQIDRLNTLFAGAGESMSAQLVEISTQLSELKKSQSKDE